MSVRCPCGREYDATLFAFGRTFECACGRRVAALPPPGPPRAADAPPRFAADAMLGRLARWLRILGLDTFFQPHIEDGDLVRRALLEGRWILTRDRRLPDEWRVRGVAVLAAERPRAQLVEVVRRFELIPWIRPFSRCPVCNELLAPLAAEDAEGRVPARIRASGVPLRACPRCGRAYWPGSHVRRMQQAIAHLADDAAADGAPPAAPRSG